MRRTTPVYKAVSPTSAIAAAKTPPGSPWRPAARHRDTAFSCVNRIRQAVHRAMPGFGLAAAVSWREGYVENSSPQGRADSARYSIHGVDHQRKRTVQASQTRPSIIATMHEHPWRCAAAIAFVTAVVFVPAIGGGFVNIDDPSYVQRNPLVLGGLSFSGIRHACTDVVFHNWAPLTILSLQLDTSLFGTAPWGYHLTNILIHAAAAGVLYLALARMTGAAGRSAAATLLFAVHPLRVESVAWIAERKDVLSVFFVAVALLAYERYCRRPSWVSYGAVVAAMLASLLAKATAVTLPALLLVLDVWPLRRVLDPVAFSTAGFSRVVNRIVLEKLPLVALAAAFAAITLATQQAAIRSEEAAPFVQVRLPNAVVACGSYLVETFWPVGLHPAHEHGGNMRPPLGLVLASAAAIASGIIAAIRLRRDVPAVAAGLAWFFLALAPVIGLVAQQGFQSRADRFTYVPHIGLMIAIVWTGAWLLDRQRLGRTAGLALVAAAVIACILLDWRQIAIWHDSVTLWRQVLVHEPKSALARMCLGEEWHDRGDFDRAEAEFRASLAIKDSTRTRDWLGLVLAAKGRLAEAYEEHAAATRLDPGFWEAHNNAGIALARMGRMREAVERFEQAAQLAPADREVHENLMRARAELLRAAEPRRD